MIVYFVIITTFLYRIALSDANIGPKGVIEKYL